MESNSAFASLTRTGCSRDNDAGALPLLAHMLEGRSIEEIEIVARRGAEHGLSADWGKLEVRMGGDALQQAVVVLRQQEMI